MRHLLSATALLLVVLAPGCANCPSHNRFNETDLSQKWVQRDFKSEIQFPYDLKLQDRYSFDPQTNTHDFVVYGSDSPHAKPPNKTNARTELRINDVFTSGEHLFDADVFIKPGTHSCIMQIFGAAHRSTTFMLDVMPDGTLSYYDFVDNNYAVIRKNMNNTWFNLKIIYNPQTPDGLGEIHLYIDNQLAFTTPGHGGKSHYFKCGLYSRDAKNAKDASRKSEVLFRNIRYFVRPNYIPETQPAKLD